ncbi:MAG: DNA/RNA nuclease SfsA [Candidatus Marinimicrobia bacterium]|nr:DNA/RNA nuclease SfsA [Candidatus Neomarinimicrobiota bacterium]
MQNIYRLYNSWEKAKYISRQNRFVMDFRKDGKKISAYIPNTGRMTEFRFVGHPFYLTPVKNNKYDYRVISTEYQGSPVLLDTIKVNDIFHQILINQHLPEFTNIKTVKREFTIGNSRFDFLLQMSNGQKILIEVKSCTLCHNGVGMFPDAPTSRGRKHIRQLHQLADKGYTSFIYYLVLNNNAKYFFPDFHIDYEYGKVFQKGENVNFRALRLNILDPTSINLKNTQEIPVKTEIVDKNCTRKGSYVLILQNSQNIEQQIGALGRLSFDKGYYVYVGSAMTNLEKRIKRHYRKRKKKHWHIDYLTSGAMEIIEDFKIRRIDRIESQLSDSIIKKADNSIKGFGASDVNDFSHLHYFKENPLEDEKFYKIILDWMTSLKA